MMTAEIKQLTAEQLQDWVEVPYLEGLIHQAVVSYQNNRRTDLAAVKNRSKVAGTNQKPWRQKGTGRSRHGSMISPLWVGGGRAHGPQGTQNHSVQLNKKMKRKALLSALGQRAREDAIYLIENQEFDTPSTSTADKMFQQAGLSDESLAVILDLSEETLRLSTRNLSYCRLYNADNLTTYHVVANSYLFFTDKSFARIKERLS